MINDKATKFLNGLLEYSKYENVIEYTCERCNSIKKSKIIVKWTDKMGIKKNICNGCYGFLLSKEQ